MGRVAAAIFTMGLSEAFRGGGKEERPAERPAEMPQPPTPQEAVTSAEDKIRKKRAAMTKTVYTSPLGLPAEANVSRKVLLGQ